MRLQRVLESVSVIGNIQPIVTVPTTAGMVRKIIFIILIFLLIIGLCIYHKYSANKDEK
ncbi:hypothetical protein [Bacillus cereus]|uniref:hypothetical protein n=1 Tax=Bacillus cereus TaxID=1396 RepID=UPI001F0A837F|nr:hypothetical protein [Bacillus cereus]